MPYDCGLFLFGLIDHEGLRELVAVLEDAGFGLIKDPFQFYAEGYTSAAYARQSSPELAPEVCACLRRLGVFALWEKSSSVEGISGNKVRSAGWDLCHPGYDRLIACQEAPDGGMALVRPHGPEVERAIFAWWPPLLAFFEDDPRIRMTVVLSRHDALSKAKDPALYPGTFGAYRNPNGAPLPHVP